MAKLEITEEQKAKIRARSAEAQSFLSSDLFKELETWIKQEQALAINALVLDAREENEKQLTREQLVERKSAYYQALPIVLGVIKGWAKQGEQLFELEQEQNEESK